MFTTGSKFFLGATVLSIVATIVVGVTIGGGAGWQAAVGLATTVVVFAFLAGINYFVRDGNVPSMQQNAAAQSAAAQPPAANSMWPLVAALGAGLVVVGTVSKPLVFKIGVVVLLAAAVEWMVQGFSERASADAAYNNTVRKRILNPLEFPLLAGGGLGLIVYSFSRIMLWIDKSGGPVIFVVVGALVLVGGFLFASRPSLKKSLIAGVCAIGALGIISTGAVMAIDGQRHIPEYPTTLSDPAVCNEEGEATGEAAEIDEKASQSVAAKASFAVTVSLRDGKLTATELGLEGERTVVTVSRSNATNIMFRNFDSHEHRFTVRMGSFTTTENGTAVTTKPLVCTQLVDHDGEQMLTVVFPKTSTASDEPFIIEVPGVEGQQIEVVVP